MAPPVPTLQVEEAYLGDWGHGLIRIHYTLMKKLGLIISDLVEVRPHPLTGKRVGVLIVPKKKDDRGESFIRMDQTIRKNLGVTIGDQVHIRRMNKQLARKITIAPADSKTRLVVKPPVLKERLVNRPVIKGEVLAVRGKIRLILPDTIQKGVTKRGLVRLEVSHTEPAGIVIVTNHTELTLRERSPSTTQPLI